MFLHWTDICYRLSCRYQNVLLFYFLSSIVTKNTNSTCTTTTSTTVVLTNNRLWGSGQYAGDGGGGEGEGGRGKVEGGSDWILFDNTHTICIVSGTNIYGDERKCMTYRHKVGIQAYLV
jgi:hypothetical protein